MKAFKNISILFLSLVVFTFTACENEPLDGNFTEFNNPNNPNTPNSNSLIGAWDLLEFNVSVSNSSNANGVLIESDVDVDSFNPDYTLTFAASTFVTNGSYSYNTDITISGQPPITDTYTLTNVSGSGSYSVSGNQMTTTGSFFEFSLGGMNISELTGEQTGTFVLSADGQTLTFTQNETETNSENGIEVTSTIIGTSTWSKSSASNVTCNEATNAVVNAETAYNNDSTNSNLCNAYVTALENKISACGDANGSIQAIIDGLGDCNTSNASIIGTWRIISLTSNGVEELQDELDAGGICYWHEVFNATTYSDYEYSGANCDQEELILTTDYSISNNIITFANGDDPVEITELTLTTLKYQETYTEVGVQYTDVYTFEKQ